MIEKLEPYLVEFDKTSQIIQKIYLLDCGVRKKEQQPVIVITYNKYIFLLNDSFCFGWQINRDTFLQFKNKG